MEAGRIYAFIGENTNIIKYFFTLVLQSFFATFRYSTPLSFRRNLHTLPALVEMNVV